MRSMRFGSVNSCRSSESPPSASSNTYPFAKSRAAPRTKSSMRSTQAFSSAGSTQSTPASISSATVKRSKEMAFAISFLSAASNAATIMRPSSTLILTLFIQHNIGELKISSTVVGLSRTSASLSSPEISSFMRRPTNVSSSRRVAARTLTTASSPAAMR